MHGQGLNPTLWPGKVVVNGNVVDRALTMFIDFSKIRGNVISNGGGNVIATDAVGTRVDEDGAPDSTEIVTNVIAGNLICLHNSPASQIGDSGGSPNTVGGNKIGECAGL